MGSNASVIVQTHWDREWYQTNEIFTARLVRIIPDILSSIERGQIDTFLFDGQTAALEDLLANCEKGVADRVVHFIHQGRITVGPWYVMPDEFLCSGESLIRNLEEGMSMTVSYGEASFLGYLPDTFGHISQMPQIFNGFGIEKAVVWRGVDIDRDLFEWRSPNGGKVACLFLPEGYYQHPFSKRDYLNASADYFNRLSVKLPQTPLLLTQGGDHLTPPNDLKDRIDEFNSAQDDYQLKLTTLSTYMDQRLADDCGKKLVLHGELRTNSNAFILPDVLSTRRYLKRLNQNAEDRLIGQIEPFLAAIEFGDAYPNKYLRDTWKLLLQQHAHDSICGCCIDEVHQEMLVRFRRIEDRLDALEKMASERAGLTNPCLNSADKPSPFADDTITTVFNPSLKKWAGWHKLNVFLAGGESDDLEVSDTTGQKYQTVLCSCNAYRYFSSPIDDFPDHIHGFVFELFVNLELGGWESTALCITKTGGRDRELKPDRYSNQSDDDKVRQISNGLVSIRVTTSGLQFKNHLSGEISEGFLSIVSEGDAGDSYNFSPPPNPWSAQADIDEWKVRDLGAFGRELEVSLSLRQPASLNENRLIAADETVTSHGTLRLRLLDGESYLRAALDWANLARDHRLRLVFPLNNKITSTVSDSAFALIERPVVYREKRDQISEAEAKVSVNPSYSYIEAGNVRIAHLAMQEFEVLNNDQQDSLGVTLIRCVGWLSRRDLITRGIGAGPDFETPDAQCLGEESFSFMISIGEQGCLSYSDAYGFRRPLLNLKGKGIITDQALQIAGEGVYISSCRRLENEIEVRLFNPSKHREEFSLDSEHFRFSDLSGNSITRDGSHIDPGEIVTLRVKNTIG